MASYSIEKHVPSCKVDHGLLERLEDYLIGRAAELGASPNDSRVEITATEKGSGRSVYKASKELPKSRFVDTLKSISFSIRYVSMAPFVSFGHVHITFDEGRWQSEYEITVEEQAQPRSKVLALSSEIDRIIDEQRTWSWIFHPRPVLGFLRWVLVVGLAGYLIGQFVSLGWGVLLAGLSPPLFPIIGAVLILDSLYSACKWLRPYCRFDTNRNNDKDIWFKWLRNGIVSLIGLAVAAILAIVRK